MAVVRKRKPASKTDVKADTKKSGEKSKSGEVTASAANVAGSEPKGVRAKATRKKSVRKEAKTSIGSTEAAKASTPAKTAVEKNSAANQPEMNTSGITKVYLGKKNSCTVTFRLPKSAVSKAKTVCIVGDFNDWNIYADPMTRRKDGTYSIDLELSKGKEYQFRYLIDDCRWENDWNADKYVKNPFGDSDNSVVIV